jgi:hypothetical protein
VENVEAFLEVARGEDMRILDDDGDRKLDSVTLYLTIGEAEELAADLPRLVSSPKAKHTHVYDRDMKKELTVCIYDEKTTDGYGFNERSKKLIVEDS